MQFGLRVAEQSFVFECLGRVKIRCLSGSQRCSGPKDRSLYICDYETRKSPVAVCTYSGSVGRFEAGSAVSAARRRLRLYPE